MPGKIEVEGVIKLLLESNPEKTAGVNIAADTDLWRFGLLDSFQVVKFISVLEERLGIIFDFTDLNAKNFRSPKAIHALLSKKYGLPG